VAQAEPDDVGVGGELGDGVGEDVLEHPRGLGQQVGGECEEGAEEAEHAGHPPGVPGAAQSVDVEEQVLAGPGGEEHACVGDEAGQVGGARDAVDECVAAGGEGGEGDGESEEHAADVVAGDVVAGSADEEEGPGQ
jgi:hypothetical protein